MIKILEHVFYVVLKYPSTQSAHVYVSGADYLPTAHYVQLLVSLGLQNDLRHRSLHLITHFF